MGVPQSERCCDEFSRCDVRTLAEWIGLPENLGRGANRHAAAQESSTEIRDERRCIACLRCVRACRGVLRAPAIGFVFSGEEIVLGTTAPTLAEAGCIRCGSCMNVCPTGAISTGAATERRRKPRIIPPRPAGELRDIAAAAEAPEAAGVFQVYGRDRRVLLIAGAPDIRAALRERLSALPGAQYFTVELAELYTQRETELLSRFLAQFGTLPEGNNEPDLY
jgi:ferredoxin